jgi:SAM-dependent methyltransferase
MSSLRRRFEDRYQTGDLPWDLERPDANLIRSVELFGIKPCNALDIGCGTGDNVLWLAKNGFTATGIDISPKAIEMAQKKSEENSIQADFFTRDILKDTLPNAPFQLIFDRGCFHTFRKKKQQRLFAKQVHHHLEAGGHWLSLIGSVDDGRLDEGPPKHTALEVVQAVEPWFEVLSLQQGRFDSKNPVPSKIWVLWVKKRGAVLGNST